MLLTGKTAAISGAASPRGIGRATARLFAEHGARVAILDLDRAAVSEAAASLPGEGHIGLACDVTDRDACRAAAAEVLAAFGAADILVNNAGITQPVKFLDIEPSDYDAVLNVSLRGTLYLSQAFIPSMQRQRAGSIVCMSSVSAQRGGGIFGGPHYSAAKAGVLGLAKAMAREFGPDGIRVNSVAPGVIWTDRIGGAIGENRRADWTDGTPTGRLGESSDIASSVLFFASELSQHVNGQTLVVDGGRKIRFEYPIEGI